MIQPVEKRLVLDLEETGVQLDNYEAMCLGPRLRPPGAADAGAGEDGDVVGLESPLAAGEAYSLVLVNDDNFNEKQIGTQILVLLLSPDALSWGWGGGLDPLTGVLILGLLAGLVASVIAAKKVFNNEGSIEDGMLREDTEAGNSQERAPLTKGGARGGSSSLVGGEGADC
jgi:hypothetical protein